MTRKVISRATFNSQPRLCTLFSFHTRFYHHPPLLPPYTMRLRLFSLVAPLILLSPAYAEQQEQAAVGGEPPNLRPLISRGNVLLGAGQFHDAAKSYSDAIELSPADYTLYYKRATAYFSLSRHSAALDDIDHVLKVTDGSFHQAFLMKARIFAKDGDWLKAKQVLKRYTAKAGKNDKDAGELVSRFCGSVPGWLQCLTPVSSISSQASQKERPQVKMR